MKHIEKVSISGIAFTLEADAYDSLKKYLDRLYNHYGDTDDGREVVSDIEARIAELILNQQTAELVVTKEQIDQIIYQLGSPEELLEPGITPEEKIDREERLPKRLYRSREGCVIGGVCSGLGRYFNINPVWIRLLIFSPVIIMLVVEIFGGNARDNMLFFLTFVLTYIILWLSIPKATTARQKLEMSGQKITASSIHEKVQSDRDRPKPQQNRLSNITTEILLLMGKILLAVMKIAVVICIIILIIVGIAIIVLIFAAIGSIIGLFPDMIVGPFDEMGPLINVISLCFAILLLITIITFARILYILVFNRQIKKGPIVILILTSILGALLMFCYIVFSKQVVNFRDLKNNGFHFELHMNKSHSHDDNAAINGFEIWEEVINEADSLSTDEVMAETPTDTLSLTEASSSDRKRQESTHNEHRDWAKEQK